MTLAERLFRRYETLMHKSFLFAALAMSLPIVASAQTPEPEFSPDRVRAHVEFLADDLLEGREAGTRGFELAARYVATQFAALGLKPAVSGGWYQQVPFRESKLGADKGKLTIGDRAFVNGTEIVFAPSAFEPNQSIDANAVFVGYGIDAPGQGVDDYAGLDVKNKVVVVLSGFPKGMPSDVGAHLARDKARMAAARGAIGILDIYTPEAAKVAPWSRRVEGLDDASLMWTGADGQPFSDARALRFTSRVNTPAAEALFAGARRSLAQVIAESDKPGGKPKGFALTPKITFERASRHRAITSPNVVAMLEGSDPVLKNEYVLLMGHLDHEGIDSARSGDRIFNGAMDNAAGIATMLEAARAMVNSGTRPKRSILFAAVTAEEKGLLGAQYLAKHPVVGAGGKVVAVVNLDMPILTYDFTDMVAFGAEHSTLGPIVERAAARDNVLLSPDPDPTQALFTRSDHYSFVKEGVPAVFLKTGDANGGKAATADFRANHYHRVSDQADLPFNWAAGAKFARINYLIAREIADAPQTPLWYADSYFGKAFADSAPKAHKPSGKIMR